MNKKILIFLFTIIFLYFLTPFKIFAAEKWGTCPSLNDNQACYNHAIPINRYNFTNSIKYGKVGNSDAILFCSQPYKNGPIGKACNEDTEWNQYSEVAVGVASILNSNYDYMDKYLMLNAYLALSGYSYKCTTDTCIGSVKNKNVTYQGYSDKKNSWTNPYYLAINDPNQNVRKNLDKLVYNDNTDAKKFASLKQFRLSVDNFKIDTTTSEEDIYVASGYISELVSGYNYELKLTPNDNKLSCNYNKNGNKFNITCKYSGNQSSVTLNIKATIDAKFDTSRRFDCGFEYQKLFIATTHEIELSKSVDKNINILKNKCKKELPFTTTKQAKIDLYEKYLQEGRDWRKILNFDSPDCEVASPVFASNNTCGYSNYENTTFNDNNLSGYKEKEIIGNRTAYCTTNFYFDSSVFISQDKLTYINSGRIIFLNQNLGNMFLQKTCYLYGNTSPVEESNFSNFKYNNYINNISVLGTNLIGSLPSNYEYSSTGNKYVLTYYVPYTKINYINKLTGEVLPTTTSNSVTVKGLVTNFNKTGSTSFVPTITFNETYTKLYNLTSLNESNNKCNYEFQPKLIQDGTLNLEFRIIDTKVPFPGESGKGRYIGSNWCDGNGVCSSEIVPDYTLISNNIKEHIIEAKNSYSDDSDAKYVIKLNSSSIKEIRNNVNKNLSYEDSYINDQKDFITYFSNIIKVKS